MRNKFLKNVSYITISNLIKFFSNVIIIFIIPNLLGPLDYGYYKIFILYFTYSGLFHFGFIDGIYLIYGGINYDKFNKERFRAYTKFLVYFQLFVSSIGLLSTIFLFQSDRKLIFILFFLNLFAINLTTYFQYISQITLRIKEYSIRTFLLSITNLFIVIFLKIFSIDDYKIYLFLIVLFNYFLLLWYTLTYKEIIFGKRDSLHNLKYHIFTIFIKGLPLLFTNLIIAFIISIDKQIVDFFFLVNDFGIYSFSFSLLSVISVVVSAIGVVVYPTLKNSKVEALTKMYDSYNLWLIFIVLVCLFIYFPLSYIIQIYLPLYVDSLPIFRIILPSLVYLSSITVIKHNYFKVLSKDIQFLYLNVLSAGVSFCLNLLFYYSFKSTIAISISFVLSIIIWYLISEFYLSRLIILKWKTSFFSSILGTILFYFSSSLTNLIISSLIYIIGIFCLLTFLVISRLINFNFKKYDTD